MSSYEENNSMQDKWINLFYQKSLNFHISPESTGIEQNNVIAFENSLLISIINQSSLRLKDSCKSLCLGSLSFLLGLLLFGILREEFFVLLKIITSSLVTVNNSCFVLSLTAETGLSNESLDLGWFVVSLVFAFDFTFNNILAHIVLLFVKSKGFDDIVSAFGTKTVWSLNISDTGDFLLSFFHNTEEDSSKISTNNAATNWLTFAFTSASRSVTLLA